MGYIASFLAGAVGFSIFDKTMQDNNGNNLINIAATGLLLFFGYKLLKKIK